MSGRVIFKQPKTIKSNRLVVLTDELVEILRQKRKMQLEYKPLISAIVHPKVISERLGHTTIGITMYFYSHVSVDMQRDAVSKRDSLMK